MFRFFQKDFESAVWAGSRFLFGFSCQQAAAFAANNYYEGRQSFSLIRKPFPHSSK